MPDKKQTEVTLTSVSYSHFLGNKSGIELSHHFFFFTPYLLNY